MNVMNCGAVSAAAGSLHGGTFDSRHVCHSHVITRFLERQNSPREGWVLSGSCRSDNMRAREVKRNDPFALIEGAGFRDADEERCPLRGH